MLTVWSDLDRTFRWMDRMLESSRWPAFSDRVPFAIRNPAEPRLSVHEAGDRYVVSADLPGLKKDDIKLSLEGSMLTIEGQRAHEVPEGSAVLADERVPVRFKRTISFREPLDGESTTASLRNGVLEIVVTKHRSALAREIPISNGK